MELSFKVGLHKLGGVGEGSEEGHGRELVGAFYAIGYAAVGGGGGEGEVDDGCGGVGEGMKDEGTV